MLESIFGNRMAPTNKRHRSRPSSQVSKNTHRTDKATSVEDDAKDVVEKQPGVEELRRRRQSYYSLSPAQRRQVATRAPGATSKAKVKSSRPASTVKSSVASKDGVHRPRRHTSSVTSKPKTRASSVSVSKSRTEEFVYGSRPDNASLNKAAFEGVEHQSEKGKKKKSFDRSEPSTAISHASSKRRILPTVIEAEVTPDDSISQVAERREYESQARQSRKAQARPPMKRNSTAHSKLQSVAEDPEERPSPALTSKRTSRRESTVKAPAAPSRRRSTTDVPSSTKLVDCLTCGSDDIPLPKSAELSCGHRMCHDCLKRIFEMSVKDPAHMPPKCCNDDHIPLKYVDKLFDLKFKVLWNRKYQEYHTRNRIYCPTPKCGEWIKPKHIHKSAVDGRKYALCPRCKTKVCPLCNNKMHKSSDCPKDPEIAKLVEQAKEKGWQRCYSCKAMVELQSGCNHMTCRCTAEFCILCGAQWKTCNCPWFNYNQIPNPDRLNDMRVPEPVRVIFRRVVDAAGGIPPPPLGYQQPAAPREPPADQLPEVTYQQELDHRRRQERDDAELARRLQLASLWEDDNVGQRDRQRRRPPGDDNTWGVGNAAGHFMNEDFVQNAANVVMGAFGDADFGRRGERSSGRRRRAKTSDQREGEEGLVPNFLGDESVLGVGSGGNGAGAGPSRRR